MADKKTADVNPDGSDPEAAPSGDARREVGKDIKQKEEIGGRDGPDPTRYNDWEKNGRCIDF